MPETWPTPDARDSQPEGFEAGMRRKERYSTWGLETAVTARQMWPTPRTEGHDAGRHRGKPDSLHSAVKLLPTPDAGMVTGGRRNPEGTSETGQTPDGRKVQVGLSNVVAGKLNADWVEALMGFPPGWMDVEPGKTLDGTTKGDPEIADLIWHMKRSMRGPGEPIGSPASPAPSPDGKPTA